jgi:hypothetical protein
MWFEAKRRELAAGVSITRRGYASDEVSQMVLKAGSNSRMWLWVVAGGVLLVVIVVAIAYGGGDSGGGSGY